jgi:RNA polymerase sigma factor (sigma-70 family)
MPTVICIENGQQRNRFLEARNALVEAHLHLVPDIAGRIHAGLPPSFDLEDLISEGNLGLIKAATRYRPRAHNRTPFSAFARKRIRGAIFDSVRRRHYTENTHFPLVLEIGDGELETNITAFTPATEENIDSTIALGRLARAMTWLPRSKRRVLLGFNSSTKTPQQQGAFRRRKSVQEIYPIALEKLKVEYRRAA